MIYDIVLKNEKEKFYKIISWLLLSVNLISVLLFTVTAHFKNFLPLIFVLLAVCSIIFINYIKQKKEAFSYSTLFLLFLLAWVVMGYWWAAVLNFLFLVLRVISLKKLTVRVSKKNIIYPSLFGKKISWDELSNVILKDDLLTLDFKNNKLIQQLIDESSQTIDEKEFNDFCKSRLTN